MTNLQLRRYTQWCRGSHGHEMLDDESGPWVRHEDARLRIERLERELAEAIEHCAELARIAREAIPEAVNIDQPRRWNRCVGLVSLLRCSLRTNHAGPCEVRAQTRGGSDGK